MNVKLLWPLRIEMIWKIGSTWSGNIKIIWEGAWENPKKFRKLKKTFRWGRLIGSFAQEDDEPIGSSEVSSNPPWSALFLGGAKVIQSSYKKRRSRSVDMSPRPSTAIGPTRTRVRRRSGSQETPDRKNIKTNRMGCSMPIARFQVI